MISIESLGLRHDGADDILRGADLVLDLSDKLHDPNVAGSPLQHMTGLDDEVFDHVRTMPGARRMFAAVAHDAIQLQFEYPQRDLRILCVCRGGRHRSVVAAREVARIVKLWTDTEVTVTHHHVNRAVLPPAV